MLLYLSLWFHPRCGGAPEAYSGYAIACEMCDYKHVCNGDEPLGRALLASEFEAKIDHPAWLT